jgi:hypothetical protein
VDLFPVIDVSVAKKTKAVWTICREFGYGWDAELGEWDAAAYADNVAMLAFYDANVPKMLKRLYAAQKHREAQLAQPTQDSYADDFDA